MVCVCLHVYIYIYLYICIDRQWSESPAIFGSLQAAPAMPSRERDAAQRVACMACRHVVLVGYPLVNIEKAMENR